MYHALVGLRYVRRFQRLPTVVPQSVSDHSFYTAILAGCFASQLQKLGVKIDRAAVIEGALWHDAAEAITSDLPADVKHWPGTPELSQIWEVTEGLVLARLGRLNSGLPAALVGAETALEHLVIKLADCTELLLYVDQERQLGNHRLDMAVTRTLATLEGPLSRLFRQCSGIYPGVFAWYTKILAALQEQVPPPAGASLHDPMQMMEEEGG